METMMEYAMQNGVGMTVALASLWFIKYMYDKQREERTQLHQMYNDNINLLRETLTENTLMLTKLYEKES